MPETPKFEIRPAHWLFGLLALIGVIMVSRHFMDVSALVELLRHANPFWLLAAAGLQLSTYISASMVLSRPLRYHGQPQRILNLLPLSLAKQFISQAVPSVGMSGTLFVIHGLEKRGVSRGVATHSVLIALLGHYLAFAIAVLVTLSIFWQLRELTNAILVPASIFFVLIALVSLAVFWFGERAKEVLPAWLLRLPVVGGALTAYQETATSSSLWNPLLVSQTTLLECLIFVLDAATLFVLLFALDANCHPIMVFASFVAASVVAMIGLVPGGMGTFEGTCVTMLHVHGVSLEAALACTLLLRGFTFWLPMLPGLWLARRELA